MAPHDADVKELATEVLAVLDLQQDYLAIRKRLLKHGL